MQSVLKIVASSLQIVTVGPRVNTVFSTQRPKSTFKSTCIIVSRFCTFRGVTDMTFVSALRKVAPFCISIEVCLCIVSGVTPWKTVIV